MFEIREAKPEEATKLREIQHRAMVACRGGYTQKEHAAWVTNGGEGRAIDQYISSIESPSEYVLVATVSGGCPLGFAIVCTVLGQIQSMYVHPNWFNNGIGSLLIEQCEELLRLYEFTEVRVCSSRPAEDFYRTNGYVRERSGTLSYGEVEVPMFWYRKCLKNT